MKHLELHIIQSVPVACLNRDDLNSPKTAVFGGVQRARVSSQSWKRAIRELAKETDSTYFKGNRSRRMVYELATKLKGKDVAPDIAVIIAEYVADIVETLDSKTDAAGFRKIKTLMFFSDAEYDAIVAAVTEDVIAAGENISTSLQAVSAFKKDIQLRDNKDEKEDAKNELNKKEKKVGQDRKALAAVFKKTAIQKAIKSAQLKDAADIALFGRMVAGDPSLKVEAASMFSHALSTHKVNNEIDFFSAVDDLQTSEESGAGMTGTLEFNSATYYRFAALNLDMLADGEHLESMTREERQDVVRTFIDATIKAIPGARKNSMNGNTLPVYVLGVVREAGHPIQLINAFEEPVRSFDGYTAKSVDLLKKEYEKLQKNWSINAVFEKAVPDVGIDTLLGGMVEYVS